MEIRVKKSKEFVIIFLFSGILRIESETIIVLLLKVRLEHEVLNILRIGHSLRIELNLLLVFENPVLLSINFQFVILLGPIVLDKFHDFQMVNINKVRFIKLIDQNCTVNLLYPIIVKVLNKRYQFVQTILSKYLHWLWQQLLTKGFFLFFTDVLFLLGQYVFTVNQHQLFTPLEKLLVHGFWVIEWKLYHSWGLPKK